MMTLAGLITVGRCLPLASFAVAPSSMYGHVRCIGERWQRPNGEVRKNGSSSSLSMAKLLSSCLYRGMAPSRARKTVIPHHDDRMHNRRHVLAQTKTCMASDIILGVYDEGLFPAPVCLSVCRVLSVGGTLTMTPLDVDE